MKGMVNFDESSKVNSKDINYHTVELVYEDIKLLDENIRLILENRKLMKRIEKVMKFEELVREVSSVGDVTYWKQRSTVLESMAKKVLPFCTTGYKIEIYKVLSGKRMGN